MRIISFSVSYIFLVACLFITTGFCYSQKIVIINPGFEELENVSDKIVKGWLPGSDESEVYIPAGSDFAALAWKQKAQESKVIADTIPFTGKFCLSLMKGGSALQTLSCPIFQGQIYKLTFHARSQHSLARLKARLYFLGGYGREPLVTKDIDLPNQYLEYTLQCKAQIPESFGYNIGVYFENISDNNQSVKIDDVTLVAEENK